MIYLDFSEINSIASNVLEYLNPFKFDGSILPPDKNTAIIATFVISANTFANSAIVNDTFNYTAEQKFFSQEHHLIKTEDAAKILQENWDLAILVSCAEIKLKDYFGLTPLYLEAVGEDEILMSISTSLPAKEALEKLHQFDNDWWIDNEPLAKGKLCIDVVSV